MRALWTGLGIGCLVVLSLVALLAFKLRSMHADAGLPPAPLTESRMVALVAGNTLPEDLAARIQKFGVTFAPSAEFRALLASAGADVKVLAAYDAAKIPAPSQPSGAGGAQRVDGAELISGGGCSTRRWIDAPAGQSADS